MMYSNQTSRFPRFTEEEISLAKSVDLPNLLTALGYQVTRVGNFHSTKEMDSLRIKNRQVWYRYSEQVGGDAISFLQHFHGKSFPEAVRFLLEWQGKAQEFPCRSPPPAPASPTKPSASQEKKKFALPPPNADNRRVFAYLRKRGIAAQVIQGFMKAGLLYEDAEHHNCVFVGRNASGKPVFANKHGTYDKNGFSFRGDVSNSDKAVAFRLPAQQTTDTVFVFEAPIDLMSYCTLHRTLTANAVALCGLSDNALASYLQDNPHLKRIVLCLDTDEPGQAAAKTITQKYGERGYTVFIDVPPNGKDWNEYLQHRQATRERSDTTRQR